MNSELLEKVKQRILTEPTTFDMSWWFCGTAACIAGHTVLEAGYRRARNACGCRRPHAATEHVGDVARKALDISHKESLRLFHMVNWPHQFWAAGDCGDVRQHSVNAAARIDHFIATGGRE